ncbi:Protein NLRC5 [Dissostichus eleginoides]|uniref:Protein NLRC5 n=1 Tax=Dissostichus eleginoides TaxID=100907 RepID=A0AAD9B6Z6_DISEL|nr:Protein NLRC5 [Dissostichus eleginoides]
MASSTQSAVEYVRGARPHLVNKLKNLSVILENLNQQGVLRDEEVCIIQAEGNDYDKNRTLLDSVTKKGEKASYILLEIIDMTRKRTLGRTSLLPEKQTVASAESKTFDLHHWISCFPFKENTQMGTNYLQGPTPCHLYQAKLKSKAQKISKAFWTANKGLFEGNNKPDLSYMPLVLDTQGSVSPSKIKKFKSKKSKWGRSKKLGTYIPKESEKADISPSDLLKTGKNILLVGKCGIGKTALTHEMLKLWTEKDDKELNYMFYFDMRKISNIKSLEDLLFNEFSEPDEGKDEVLQDIKNNSDNVTLIFDGITDLSQSSPVVQKLVDKDLLQYSKVVLTCRPADEEDLPSEDFLRVEQCLTEKKHMKHLIPYMCRLLTEKSPSLMECLIPAEELKNTSNWFLEEVISTFLPSLCENDDPDTKDSGRILFLCQCLFESQCPEACIDLLEKLNYRLDLSGESLDPYPCCAVAYVINQSKERKTWLNLEDVTISQHGMRPLLGCLQNVQWCDSLPRQLWEIFLLSEGEMDYITLLGLDGNQLHLPVEGDRKLFERAVSVLQKKRLKVKICLHWERENPDCHSLCETLPEALPNVSSLSFRRTYGGPGLQTQERCYETLKRQEKQLFLDLCLKAATLIQGESVHNESVPAVWSINLSERKTSILLEVLRLQPEKKQVKLRGCSDGESEVRTLLQCLPYISQISYQSLQRNPQCDFLLDLASHLKDYETETGLSVLPSLQSVLQSAPAVWNINLSQRKTSILLEVLRLQPEKKQVELRGCSDEESEVRTLLQCLPYISQLSFWFGDSGGVQFFGTLFCAAAEREQQTGEKTLELLSSVCTYPTFPLPHKQGYGEYQCDFLLDLYSHLKDYETETGLSVLPSLQSVLQSAPAVWFINLSERKTSILLEVLRLQPEKKQVKLRGCSDGESEVRTLLQCLPYISKISFRRTHRGPGLQAQERCYETLKRQEKQLFLDLCLKAATLIQGESVHNESVPAVWSINLSERKTSILLEVLRLQPEKKQVELRGCSDGESEVRTLLQCLPYISKISFRRTHRGPGLQAQERCYETLKRQEKQLFLDLCLKAATLIQGESVHNERKTSILLEVLRLQPEKKQVELRGCSDGESEVRTLLQCLPYISKISFRFGVSGEVKFFGTLFCAAAEREQQTGEKTLELLSSSVLQSAPAVWFINLSERKTSILLEVLRLQPEKKQVELRGCSDGESEVRTLLQCLPYISQIRFRFGDSGGVKIFGTLFCAAAEREQQTGEKTLELLSSVCTYPTFPLPHKQGYEEYQCDFLLDLYSHLKDCEVKFFGTLFCAAAEREQQTGEKTLELLSSVCTYPTFPFTDIIDDDDEEYQCGFLLDLYSHLKDYETETVLSVLPSLQSVLQSAPAVWTINLSERKTSILLEVLRLQPEKKQVELRGCSDGESEVRTLLQCLAYISKISFRRTHRGPGLQAQERCYETLKREEKQLFLDLCLKAATLIQGESVHNESVPAVWSINLSERKTSILLEVLRLQPEKKQVELRGCSDGESEVRTLLQCLPYISKIRSRFVISAGVQFFGTLFCAAAEREQQTGEKTLELLSSVCTYPTFPLPHKSDPVDEEYQCDFLLDLASHLKDYETETGLSVLPSLQSVLQSAPAVWNINLSERKTSILLEVLRLQPEKKQVELRGCSDGESEVRTLLQCLPYISKISFRFVDSGEVKFFGTLFCAAAEREQQTGEKTLELLSSRKTSILLEVLRLQPEKKQVELRGCSDGESEVRTLLQCLPYISKISCGPEFFQRVCTFISVRSREEAERLASLLQLSGFTLLLSGELPRKTCLSVGRVLQLCGSKVDLILKPRKMSVKRAFALFRRTTQLHSLKLSNDMALLLCGWVRRWGVVCQVTVEELSLSPQTTQPSRRVLLKVVSSLASLLRYWAVRQLDLTEVCVPALGLTPLLLHDGPLKIKLSEKNVQQLLSLLHELQDEDLTWSFLSKLGGDLTSFSLNWELLHLLLQHPSAQTLTVNMRKNPFLQENITRLLPYLDRIVFKRPCPSFVLTAIREIYKARASPIIPSLLRSLDHVINLTCREMSPVDCVALLYTLAHSDGVKLNLLWTSIPAWKTQSILLNLDKVSQLSVDRNLLLRMVHGCAASDAQQGAAETLLRTVQHRLDLSCSSYVELPEEDQSDTLRLTAGDCRAVSTILRRSRRDTQLILQDCEVQDSGLDLLFPVLHTVKLRASKAVLLQLVSLVPVNSERDTVGRAVSLCKALEGELDLSHSSLDQRACAALALMLDFSEELTELDLSHCQLTDQLLLTLSAQLHKVQVLDLSHNNITDASTDLLLQLVSINPSIHTVRLFGNKIVERTSFEKDKKFEIW